MSASWEALPITRRRSIPTAPPTSAAARSHAREPGAQLALGGVKLSEGDAELSRSFDVRWVATLRGRAGLAFDATLVDITGGLAFGGVDNSLIANIDDGGLTGSFIDGKTRLGWTAGVGVEHMFAPHWTLRGEWRYVDLGTHGAQCANGNDVCTGTHVDFSNTLMLGLVGLAYKF